MKYLGIDFGSKRIGLSVSDESGLMAFPHSIISNSKNTLAEIENILKKENIKEVVVGESKNFEGNPNKIMAEIEVFAKNLEKKFAIKVNFEPEFMTSVQAEIIQGKNKMHDASAAAIILQSHLDRLK